MCTTEETPEEKTERLELAISTLDALIARLPHLGMEPVVLWKEDGQLRQCKKEALAMLEKVKKSEERKRLAGDSEPAPLDTDPP